MASCSEKEQNNDIEQKIQELVGQMTLEEKVGQMTQIKLTYFLNKGKWDEEKFKETIIDKKVGSVLNNDYSAIEMERWHKIINKIQDAATKETRLGIPVLYGIDAIHGTNYTQNATIFPHNIGVAATRNTRIAHQIARITAAETRASGIRWNFDPVLGVAQNPIWPRYEETFGEDPFIVEEMGVAAIGGYEEDGLKSPASVASCIKHYIGYPLSQSGKDRTPAYLPEIFIKEYLEPPFKAAVENGSMTLMVNSASINGVPIHVSKKYLTDILKKKWGYKGLVVTDWKDIIYLYTEHKVARNNKEAVKMAINAGIDMSMVPNDFTFYDDLIQLVREGEVPMSRINNAVTRILRVKFATGLMENPSVEEEAIKNFGKAEYKETALNAAQQSLVLLENINKALPLDKNQKVFITGPAANTLAPLHGSWSYTWQGDKEELYPKHIQTIKEAIEQEIGKENVICPAQNDFNHKDNFSLRGANNASTIILCLGENAYAETPGNIDNLDLSENQVKLAKEASAKGKKVILVLAEGRPRIVNTIVDKMDGILLAMRPGEKGAEAIADVLFGNYNPNGILPFSYPKQSGNIITYYHSCREAKFYDPQWPFGHGLSYTTFKLGNINLNQDTISFTDTLKIAIEVKNTGQRKGQKAIDLFTRDSVASIIPPQKRLRRFTKIELNPGESKKARFFLTSEDLQFHNSSLNNIAEEGEFQVMIENQKQSFYLKK